MKILCITDQSENSNHSSIEGILAHTSKRDVKSILSISRKPWGRALLKATIIYISLTGIKGKISAKN